MLPACVFRFPVFASLLRLFVARIALEGCILLAVATTTATAATAAWRAAVYETQVSGMGERISERQLEALRLRNFIEAEHEVMITAIDETLNPDVVSPSLASSVRFWLELERPEIITRLD